MLTISKAVKIKMGRPKLPKGQAKTVMLAIRFSESEASEILKASKKAGQHHSEWSRNQLLKAARSGNI